MRIKMLAVLLTAAVALSGCGAAAAEQSYAGEVVLSDGEEVIYGKIKEINGNEMLLAIGTYQSEADSPGSEEAPAQDGLRMPETAPDAAGGEGESATGNGSARGGMRPGNGGAAPSSSGEGQSAAEIPEGVPGGGAWPGGGEDFPSPPEGRSMPGESGEVVTGMPEGGRGGMARGTFTLTGEERTFLIPVTATITTGQGENARTIQFTRLAVKNVVCLHLASDGEITAMEVLQ